MKKFKLIEVSNALNIKELEFKNMFFRIKDYPFKDIITKFESNLDNINFFLKKNTRYPLLKESLRGDLEIDENASFILDLEEKFLSYYKINKKII